MDTSLRRWQGQSSAIDRPLCGPVAQNRTTFSIAKDARFLAPGDILDSVKTPKIDERSIDGWRVQASVARSRIRLIKAIATLIE